MQVHEATRTSQLPIPEGILVTFRVDLCAQSVDCGLQIAYQRVHPQLHEHDHQLVLSELEVWMEDHHEHHTGCIVGGQPEFGKDMRSNHGQDDDMQFRHVVGGAYGTHRYNVD